MLEAVLLDCFDHFPGPRQHSLVAETDADGRLSAADSGSSCCAEPLLYSLDVRLGEISKVRWVMGVSVTYRVAAGQEADEQLALILNIQRLDGE